MKQLILGFAACALIMTSCTQQEITENVTDGQGQLSFSTGLGKQSPRAAELMNLSLQKAASKENGVALRAYQEITPEGTFKQWYDDKLWYDQTAKEWKIESVRFRNEAKTKYITYFSKAKDDKGQSLLKEVGGTFVGADFIAVDKFPQFTYKVNTASNYQEDLIAGITEIPANQTNITLGMRHILSQVNFGTVGYKGANIAIRNIQIVGLYNSAKFTYNAADTYPIGEWDTYMTDDKVEKIATYEYYKHSNADVEFNPQPTVPATANKGDIYIFGDGGNWGPGKTETIFYPVAETTNNWEAYNAEDPQTSLANSLILMPQDLASAKVTFEYRITDVDGTFVAGAGGPGEDDWAKGEFKLDFKTGTIDDKKSYLGKWDQNYRYVYLINFTDFLDNNALTFTVDVEMYPWENYNGDGDDDGIVDIMVAAQPSEADMSAKTFIDKDTWYIATQSETAPTTPPSTTKTDWAQVVRNEKWNLSAYNFRMIEKGNTFILNFQNVIFNTSETPSTGSNTTITLTLPNGYTAVNGAGITMAGNSPTYTISEGDKSVKATITITNTNVEYSTASTLSEAIAKSANSDALIYKGLDAVDLKTIEPTALIITGNKITVKFNDINPTVGATTNGVWTWNASTRTATWTRWNDLTATTTAFKAAVADLTIYCSNTEDINLSTTFGDPIDPTNSPIKIVFSTAAVRTPGVATAAGTWSYNAATKTATWTKN